MGFGVLEAKTASGEHVPGTSTIYNDEVDGEELVIQSHLKHGWGNDKDVILVPQPSDSPNDPLVSPCVRVLSCQLTSTPELANVEEKPDLFLHLPLHQHVLRTGTRPLPRHRRAGQGAPC